MAQVKQKVSSTVKLNMKYKIPAWATRSQYYLLEFIVALIGLSVVTALIDRMLFILMQYAVDAPVGATLFDKSNLVIVAMALVWTPIMALFYARSRSEEINRPAVANTKLRRFFLYVFMLGTLVATTGFTLSALLSLLQMAFGATSSSDTLVTVTIPSILAAVLHGYIFRTFMEANTTVGVRRFVSLVGGVSVILLAVLLGVTAVRSGGALTDEKISSDLKTISEKIRLYVADNNEMPANMGALQLSSDIEKRAGKYGYTYEQNGTLGDYKLCAKFKTDTSLGEQPAKYYYQISPDFSHHKKGQHCFEGSAMAAPYGASTRPSTPSTYDDIMDSMENYKSSMGSQAY